MAEIVPREFVNIELKLIEKVFDQTHVLRPMVVLIKNNERYVIPAAFSNDLQKDIVSQGIKDLVKNAEPDIVIYSCEAWSATLDEYIDGVTPPASQQPNRVEIIAAQIEFKTGEKYSCQARILRHGDQPPRLDKFEVSTGGMSMGRFVDFFPITRTN
jgi:hypothetical protein